MEDFRAMHRPGDPFVLANAWDVGSARMLVALGAKAIGTSSAGLAFTRGLPDGGRIGRGEAIAHARDLADHVRVPVSADLEDGYGPEPSDCGDTVAEAARAGLAGCCIEDVDPEGSPYGFEASVARIVAAVSEARRASHDFVLCARADGVLRGRYDVDEAIARLRAFREAGADVLYAPMLPDVAALARVCAEVDGPVNALVAGEWTRVDRATFASAGVARISLGSSLARATHRLIRDAGTAMFERGDFADIGGIASSEVDDLLARGGT